MKKRTYSAQKLDVETFIRDGESLAGEWPAQSLSRLADAAAPEAPASGWPAVSWSLQGEARPQRRGEPQLWLQLQAQATVHLTCQRCLKPVEERIEVDNWVQFVGSEDEAAALDMDSEDDVLALTRHLDAQELIEDELLLALPLVPRHETCPEPLPVVEDEEPEEEEGGERPNPFAALAALKGKGGGNAD